MMTLSKLLQAYENDLGFVCDTEKCTCQAVFVVSIHAINFCDRLGATNSFHVFACGECAVQIQRVIYRRLMIERDKITDGALWVQCTTCKKQFGILEDACALTPLVNNE